MFFVILIFFNIVLLKAQQSVNSSGGNSSGSGGSVVYSFGQVVYTTNLGSAGSVSQGVQHAYEVFTIGIKKTTLDISLSVFPNPTTHNLTVYIANYNKEILIFQLFDIEGQLLKSGQIVSNQTNINMSNYTTATYFINILNQDNKKIQSFKILKK